MSPLSLPLPWLARIIAIAVVILLSHAPESQADEPEAQFYRAYYLEQAVGDTAKAAELYEQILKARGLPENVREKAQYRLAACREDLVTADFATLMPPEPLAYVEINRPGERLNRLLDQLGLLADAHGPQQALQNRVAVSPAILNAVLGLRGMAVAVTGFDPVGQKPSGVAVLHPGDVELIRGLIETALPIQSEMVDPIGGHPTFVVEEVYVTLTQRLVIAGTSAHEIEGVIDRLQGKESECLAGNPELAGVLKERQEALAYFCINPKPLMPMINMLAGSGGNHELALAQALLDIRSFRSLTGRFDISDEGLLMELSLRLDEGHRNLVYNFMRRPALDPEALRCVPRGAAALVSLSMNEAPAKYAASPASPEEAAVVTALDLGRELFANINGIAVYALPPEEGAPLKGEIPDVAAVITVNDPAKSQAIWYQMLGLGSLAAGARSMEGEVHQLAGVDVRSYRFDDEVTVHVGALDHDLFIASTESALERSLQARRGGTSILDDPGLARPLGQLDEHTTLAVVVHPARCMAIARRYMDPGEFAEMEPIAKLLTETTACVLMRHSDRMLRLSANVTGIPDVSGLVTQMLTEQRQGEQRRQEYTRAVKKGDFDEALAMLDSQIAQKPQDFATLQKKFNLLAVQKQDYAAAAAMADDLLAALQDDAMQLNNLAWALLTEERYGERFDKLALRLAQLSNERSDFDNWAYLDTLALAEFRAGNATRAVELEEQAIELCRRSGGGSIADLQQALERFQQAVAGVQ